jgi:hypothetical protein
VLACVLAAFIAQRRYYRAQTTTYLSGGAGSTVTVYNPTLELGSGAAPNPYGQQQWAPQQWPQGQAPWAQQWEQPKPQPWPQQPQPQQWAQPQAPQAPQEHWAQQQQAQPQQWPPPPPPPAAPGAPAYYPTPFVPPPLPPFTQKGV